MKAAIQPLTYHLVSQAARKIYNFNMHFPFWVILAFIVALAQAGLVLTNERFQVRPIHLLWWMRLISALALAPAAWFVPWPTDGHYYLYVALSGLVFAYTDLYVIGLAARSGAGVVTRLEPLIVGATFLLWTAMMPSLAMKYLHEPIHTVGIVLALLGGTFFALRLRHCVVSRAALRTFMPVIVLSAIGIVFGKLAMNHTTPKEGAFYYTFLQACLVWVIYTVAMVLPAVRRRIPDLGLESSMRDRRALLAGLAAGFFWLIATPVKWLAIAHVENPAYVSLIGMTQPFWVLLVYRFSKRQESADIWSGLGIVACAILLVICTQL